MLNIVTPPAMEPVSLDEVFDYLRADMSNAPDVTYVQQIVTAAREWCEGYQRRAYITQTLELVLDEFPDGAISIPRGKLQSVTSVKYKDSDGVEHTLTDGADYVVAKSGVTGRIVPVDSWPSAALYPAEAVKIVFVCGYGNFPDSVPARAKQAIMMLVSYWFDNRSAVGTVWKEIEFSVHALLGLDRIAVV